MMPTKRRPSVGDSISGTDDTGAPTPKKGRKSKGAVELYDQVAITQELFETIRNFKAEDGRTLCESIARLPKRRTSPEYYELIKDPIDMLRIQQKIKNGEYDEIEQLTDDVTRLVHNAKQFYQRSSLEYQDACQLWTLYQNTKDRLIAAAFGESSEKTADPKCRQLLDAVKNLKNGERLLCEVFMQLPDKQELPLYYQVIQHPIDLNTISKKLALNKYGSVDEIESDLDLMIKNAMQFNEPGSQIFRDAETIKLMMSAVMSDLMLASPTAISSKDKRRRKSADISMEETEDEEVTADEEEASMISFAEDETRTGNPFWVLFKTVVTHVDEDGKSTIKPFLTLPSRRWFPDYYEDIANPISMTQIKKKIKKGKYSSLNAMAADLNLMFENAKEYNTDESKIFQNAIEMQSKMWEKKKELDNLAKGESEQEDLAAPASRNATASRNRIRGKARAGRGSAPKLEAPNTPETAVEEESNEAAATPTTPPNRGRSRNRQTVLESEKSLKKRLLAIYNAVYDCEEDNRSLIEPFVELPSKEEYPDYYDYIEHPVDMNMIERKLQTDQYASEKELISELKLMFNNARTFNEDSSQIYRDSITLERAMKAKVMQLSINGADTNAEVKKTVATMSSTLSDKLMDLYETVKYYEDMRQRVLSGPFVRLPSKQEYPDYYEVIKKPIDLVKIFQKIQGGNYDCLESLFLDMHTMFDNAMEFNEPDSLLFKDAACLLHVCISRYYQLEDPSIYDIPNSMQALRVLIQSLYNSTLTHRDEDGRCFSDSITELDGQTTNELTFAVVERNVKADRYRRLDKFQEDMFAVCERARKLSSPDSQVYEDSVELQKYFITLRDKLCKNGEVFSSPAISFTHKHLQKSVDEEQAKRFLPQHQDTSDAAVTPTNCGQEETSAVFCGKRYDVGDFVYIKPRESGVEPHIIHIEKLWRDSAGECWLFGVWFYRPGETFHQLTKKFLKREVFRSDVFDSMPLSAIVGRCCVLFVKDYFKNTAVGFSEEDVYVCESTYSKKSKSFKKIKAWSTVVTLNPKLSLTPRETALQPERVASVFADKGKSVAEPDVRCEPLDKARQTVELQPGDGDPNCTYYEQLVNDNGCFKLGDCVYVANGELDLPLILKIEKILKNNKGELLVEGPSFMRPSDIEHSPARLFYDKELFLASKEESRLIRYIRGKCAVLWIRDYCTYRPIEIDEKDVYICESKYHDSEKVTRKIPKGFKKPSLSTDVCDDELYFLSRKFSLRRVASPLLVKLAMLPASEDTDGEDSQDGIGTPVITGPVTHPIFDPMLDPHSQSVSPAVDPGSSKKEKKKRKHHITSFQLFANDIRKSVTLEFKDAGFGEVSKIIASRWRCVDPKMQQKYKNMAAKLQAEAKAKEDAAESAAMASRNVPTPPQYRHPVYSQQQAGGGQGFPAQNSQTPQQIGAPPQQQQSFPFRGDMWVPPPQHPMQAPFVQGQSHVYQQQALAYPQQTPVYQQQPALGFPQQGPVYQAQQAPGYQQQPHAMGGPAHRPSPAPTPEQLFYHQQQQMQAHLVTNLPAATPSTQGTSPAVAPRPSSPLFVSVDLGHQKLAHSDVYLKYISGLRADNPVKVSSWERELSTDSHPISLPPVDTNHWLRLGEGAHGSSLNALHALRDLMLKDSLRLVRSYNL